MVETDEPREDPIVSDESGKRNGLFSRRRSPDAGADHEPKVGPVTPPPPPGPWMVPDAPDETGEADTPLSAPGLGREDVDRPPALTRLAIAEPDGDEPEGDPLRADQEADGIADVSPEPPAPGQGPSEEGLRAQIDAIRSGPEDQQRASDLLDRLAGLVERLTEAADLAGGVAARSEVGVDQAAEPPWAGRLQAALADVASGLQVAVEALDPERTSRLAAEVAEMRSEVSDRFERSTAVSEEALEAARTSVAAAATLTETIAGQQSELAALATKLDGVEAEARNLLAAVGTSRGESTAAAETSRERLVALLGATRGIQDDLAKVTTAEQLEPLQETAQTLLGEMLDLRKHMVDSVDRASQITETALVATRSAIEAVAEVMRATVADTMAQLDVRLGAIQKATDPEVAAATRAQIGWLVEAAQAEATARQGSEPPAWMAVVRNEIGALPAALATNTDQTVATIHELERRIATGVETTLPQVVAGFDALAAQVAAQHAETRAGLDEVAAREEEIASRLGSLSMGALTAMVHKALEERLAPLSSDSKNITTEISHVSQFIEGLLAVLEANEAKLRIIEAASSGPDDVRTHLAALRAQVGGLAREMGIITHAVGVDGNDDRPLTEVIEDALGLQRQILSEIIESRGDIAQAAGGLGPATGGSGTGLAEIAEMLRRLTDEAAASRRLVAGMAGKLDSRSRVAASVGAVEAVLDEMATEGVRPDAVIFAHLAGTTRDIALMRLAQTGQAEDIRVLVERHAEVSAAVSALTEEIRRARREPPEIAPAAPPTRARAAGTAPARATKKAATAKKAATRTTAERPSSARAAIARAAAEIGQPRRRG